MVGASMEGKNDPITDLVTNIPAGYNLVNEVSGKVGKIVTKPISAVDSRLTTDRVTLKTDRESRDINEKFYTNQAKEAAVNSKISDAEREREALLRRFNKRLEEENKRKNGNP